MMRARSTPESIVVITISFLRGTGERLGLSMAQFSDMVMSQWTNVMVGAKEG